MTKVKKAKTKAITLGEFKTWIDGYCAASGPEWTPTAEQWALIRDKIESIVEQPTQQSQAQRAPQRQYAPQLYTETTIDTYTPYVQPESERYVPPAPVLLPKQEIKSFGRAPSVAPINNIQGDTVGSPSPFG